MLRSVKGEKMSRSYCAMILAWGVACFLVAFSTGKANADIIWQGPQNITGDLDVSTLGNLVRAWSAVNASNTINGVTFSLSGGGAPQGAFIIGGPGFGVGSSIYNNLSVPYKSLLNSAVYRDNGDSIMTIDLNGLTNGRVYEFQAFVNDSRDSSTFGGGNINYGRSNVFDSGAGSIQSQSVFQPLNAGTTNIGQHIKGTFTANGNTQHVRILGDALTGPKVSLINAYQVRDITAVPEPSSILLLSSVAGLTGMFLRKRRSRKEG